MANSTPPPTRSDDPDISLDLQAKRDVNVGGDVVGRDKVVQVGFDPTVVQRLLITVGVLVFVTAACFFSGGVVAGGAIAVLLQTTPASAAAAQSMQAKIDSWQSLSRGDRFQDSFTEAEINSYVQYIVGPQIGLAPGTGTAHILADGQLAVGGQLVALGNRPVVVVFKLQPGNLTQPLKLTAAAVEVLPLHTPAFGWVAVPPALLQPMETRVNSLFAGVEFTQIETTAAGLAVQGVRQ